MKNRIIILMLISLCINGFSNLAQAQESITPSVLGLLDQMNKYNDNPVNSVYTYQNGCSNIAQITSSQTVDDGQSIIKVCQLGGSNTAIVDQVGNKQTSTISQLGCENDAIVNSDGQSIYSVVKQVGCGNYVKQDIDNEDETTKMVSSSQYGVNNKLDIEITKSNSTVNVLQSGFNNTLSVEVNDQDNKNYTATQIGNNAEATIRHSAFYTPMKTF